MDPMSDVEVISIDDDDREEGGGRSGAGLRAEDETCRQDTPQDEEDVQIGDSRNYRHHHHQARQEHQRQRFEERDDDNDSDDYNEYGNDDDENDSFEPEEEIFSQDPQGLEESKIIESCCRQQQQASMAPLTSAEEQDGDQFGALFQCDVTQEEDEPITQRQGRGQTHRYREQVGAPRQSASAGPLPSPPRPDVECVDLTVPSPGEHRRLRGQGASEAFLSFRTEYGELLERNREAGLGFPFEAVAELLLRHPEQWWCRYPEAMTEMLLSSEGGLEGDRGSAVPGAWRGGPANDENASRHTTTLSRMWEEASAQLCACRHCLRAYHVGKERLCSRLLLHDTEESEVQRLMEAILSQDSVRLQRSFRATAKAAEAVHAAIAAAARSDDAGAAGAAAAAADPSAFSLGADARHAFWEVLSYPRLLEDGGIEKTFLRALVQVNSSDAERFCGIGWERHWPGVLALLVHRDAAARAWAQSMAKRAGKIGAKVYREFLSPIIDLWVPVLEQNINASPSAASGEAGQGEKERLHWSGLHVALQLLESEAAPLMATEFPTLVDLILQTFDDGPGDRPVSLYLQVCGCLTAFFRLLGSRIWKYSTLQPSEVLDAIERQAHDGGEASRGRGGGKKRPSEAIQKHVIQALPLLVASTVVTEPCRFSNDGRSGGRDGVSHGAREAEYGRGTERGVAGGGGGARDETPLADDALEFLSREILALPAAALLRRKVLTNALLDILEVCYDRRPVAAAGEDTSVTASGGGDSEFDKGFRYTRPESWPWNSETGVVSAGGVEDAVSGGGGDVGYRRRRRQWPLSWPVRSLPRWAPRLADAAADRNHLAGAGGGGEAVSDLVQRASKVVELVLHRHAGAAWRTAICALRGGPGGSPSRLDEAGRVGEEREEEENEEGEQEVLPIFGPLLERICLELPLLDVMARVHAAVFQAHGWLSLLPCGDAALRAANASGGPSSSRTLAKLHSGLVSQFLKLFVPYVQGLTEAVKRGGASCSPALRPEVMPSIFQALLAPIPSSRAAIEDLLSCSMTEDARGYRLEASKKGDLRPLLRRLPMDCARACFLVVPQVNNPRAFYSGNYDTLLIVRGTDDSLHELICATPNIPTDPLSSSALEWSLGQQLQKQGVINVVLL